MEEMSKVMIPFVHLCKGMKGWRACVIHVCTHSTHSTHVFIFFVYREYRKLDYV